MDGERPCDGECFVASGNIAPVRLCFRRVRVSQLLIKETRRILTFLGVPSHVLLQCSSFGKVLLAHLTGEWSVTRVTLPNPGLEPFNENTTQAAAPVNVYRSFVCSRSLARRGAYNRSRNNHSAPCRSQRERMRDGR